MIKEILYSIKKSNRLRKISMALGHVATLSPSGYSRLIMNEGWGERDIRIEREKRAMEALLNMCESDPYTLIMMKKYNADRETLTKAYKKLIEAGAGQWKGGHYIPASSLVYNQALDYLLKNIDKNEEDFRYVAWTLLKYFENRRTGIIEE